MEIRRNDSNSLIVAEKSAKVLITAEKSKTSDVNFTVGPHSEEFSRPGEYEYNDITVIVAEQRDTLIGYGNLFKVILGGVNYLFVCEDINKLQKDTNDFIGQVDLLLVTSNLSKSTLKELTGNLEPRFIAIVDAVETNKAEEVIDLPITLSEKVHKFKPESFPPEYVTQHIAVI